MSKVNSYRPAKSIILYPYFKILILLLAGFIYQNILIAQVSENIFRDNWRIISHDANPNLTADDLNEFLNGITNEDWIDAKRMPAMVSDILLENGRIEAPWLPGKAKEYNWISKKDWIYKSEFEINDTNLNSILKFYGLDCIVDIYLNREKIASYSNMYIPLEINISGKLKKKNELIIYFHSVFDRIDNEYEPIKRFIGERVRRPNQSYLNYLGPDPYFSRVGVFDDIILSQYSDIHIDNASVSSSLNKELSIGEVKLQLKGTAINGDHYCVVSLIDLNEKILISKNFQINQSEGKINSEHKIEIEDPILWWPRGYGNPYLYSVKIDIKTGEHIQQSILKKIGFRRVEMEKLFHFVVNNKPVKLWGGDWVAPDWTTAVWDKKRAEKLFELAENANFNAFRVWGVVESPDDHFYELADERGFMLWQDFTNLPLSADKESIEICKTESAYMIKRLQHHPSVFLWCGGNENALWHHKEYNGPLEDRGDWPGTAATDEIEKIVNKLDPDRYFFPTSPYMGIDPNDPKEGNTHGYTNLWFVPGYDYLNFASEDTRISCPTLESMKKFMLEEDIWPNDYSPIFKHGDVYPFPETWMKYSTSFSWRKMGPIEQYYDPYDAASLVYRIGMAEAQYYRETIERQRRGRSASDDSGERFCGGYLVWKYNDSWPQIYSAKVDYFLEPYHAYYALKSAYKPVMLSFDFDSYITLWAVNDSKEKVKGTVTFKLFHLDKNEVRAEISKKIEIDPDQSQVVVDLYKEGIGSFRLEHVLFAELRDENNEIIAVTHSLADIERDIIFPDAELNISIDKGDLILTTDKYAKSVHLSGNAEGDEFDWFFEDNYFDLMPGEVKKVKILGSHEQGIITAKPWYSSKISKINYTRK